MRNISDKIVEEIRTHILRPVAFFFIYLLLLLLLLLLFFILPFMRCVGKYLDPGRPQMKILYDACALYAG